jgi:hypothetical protein
MDNISKVATPPKRETNIGNNNVSEKINTGKNNATITTEVITRFIFLITCFHNY